MAKKTTPPAGKKAAEKKKAGPTAADILKKGAPAGSDDYTAHSIEVLEGLEPVRKRPGMYIGGTDERALHHLVAEILDNSMDEAVAGHANKIEVTLEKDGSVTIADNGRGIPIDNHPKYPGKSALEVILTTLHSGGKFNAGAYKTSGGLHGVGSSVVNALSDKMIVEVARDKKLYRQEYSRGAAKTKLQQVGPASHRGTKITFHPDAEIFGSAELRPGTMHRLCRSKAYLFRGVEIKWHTDIPEENVPENDVFKFPGGLEDFLKSELQGRPLVTPHVFADLIEQKESRVEFAVAWPSDYGDGWVHSYCNTIPTPQGGTHEQGLRTALVRSLKDYATLINYNAKQLSLITTEDVMEGACVLLSVFIGDPQFQGQTKDKLATPSAERMVQSIVKDRFDHFLTGDPASARGLLEAVVERAEHRLRRKEDKDMLRKTATRKLRLPGKLADCSRQAAQGTEIFIVEGDSAGGSAKQGRSRETQAILPLRGKILNVVSATRDKIRDNQEIQDLILAMGVGTGSSFKASDLRYERIIIMTDADVDGAHISSLLISFFYTQMPGLIDAGYLYLAQPPLYRMSAGGVTEYARDDKHREELLKTTFRGRTKIDVSRFKGLGEMPAAQLKETTMNPKTRTLLRVTLPMATAITESLGGEPVESTPRQKVDELIENLMGKNAEARFNFIQANALSVAELDI